MAAQERFPGMSEEALRREIRELRGQIAERLPVARDIIEEAGLPRPTGDSFPEVMRLLREVIRGRAAQPPGLNTMAEDIRLAIGEDMGQLHRLLRERSARRNRW